MPSRVSLACSVPSPPPRSAALAPSPPGRSPPAVRRPSRAAAAASSRPAAATVGCGEGGSDAGPLAPGWRATSAVSGPLTLAYVKHYATQPAAAFAPSREQLAEIVADPRSTERERRLARETRSHTRAGSHGVAEVLVRVAAGQQATVAVAREQRSSVGLVYSRRARNQERRGAAGAYRVADADPALTFGACPGAATDFLGGLVVAGARCVRLTVTTTGRPPEHLRLPFGSGSCPPLPAEVSSRRVLRREPYLGVSCPTANSFACDRVGLALWLRGDAKRVSARIAGRPLRLESPDSRVDEPPWIGYLRPAGMLDGALRLTPDRGRFHREGRHPRDARLVINVTRRDGTKLRTRLTVPLRAGWG